MTNSETLAAMDLKEFTLRFLNALDFLDNKLEHLGTGHGKHPKLKTVWVRNCADDLKTEGFESTKKKYAAFIGLPIEKHATPPASKRGRPRLGVPLAAICDALRGTKSISLAARNLGCSRAYIYKVVGAEKVREFIESDCHLRV